MVEWNPVEGLEEIKYEDLQVGDEVVQFAFGRTYSRVIIEKPKYQGCNDKYYLLNRAPVPEPEGQGDLAEIYRINPKGDENEEVEIYVRTRQKFLDTTYGDSKPWTNTDNDGAFKWEQIVSFSTNKPGRAIRTYTATYKEN